MSTQDLALAELVRRQCGVVTRLQAARHGVSHSALATRRATGAWRSLLPGIYLVDAPLHPQQWRDLALETRLCAATLFHGPSATLVLSTSARLLGWPVLPPDDGTIHLRLPPGQERHQQRGVCLHTWALPPEHVTAVGGYRTTTVLRTLTDLLLRLPRPEAVSVIDAVLNAEIVTPTDLVLVEALFAGRRGAVAARRRLAEADGRAESALETRVRLTASDAGFPPHHLQYPVRDTSGVLLGRGDMAYDRPGERPLVVEADGVEVHSLPEALYRDRLRANDFVTLGGVDVVRFTWADLWRRGYIASVLRSNLRSA